ncbi:cytochrome P450 [Bradyrhizobium sp. AZCC 1678]|uniref:cytochrome P450 n=1 Tax=Bradyrhizobium sp. AZCC 1678 TaxID=3117030 RepID=UPI002FF21A89
MSEAQVAAYPPQVFNPLAPEVVANPYSFYQTYRESAPVYKTPLGFWLVTAHEYVSSVLTDRRFERDFARETTVVNGPGAMEDPLNIALSKMLVFLDPPDHTRIRKLVSKAFSARRVEELRPQIERVAADLLGKVRSRGEMDIVADFALPLPMTVMFNLLGVPEPDREYFARSFRVTSRVLDFIPLTPAEKKEAIAQLDILKQYFTQLINVRRREPGDDLISNLVRVEEAGDTLGSDELLANIILLFVAGHETTSNSIANSMYALHSHHDQLEELKRHPEKLSAAVDELLRFESAVQLTARSALETVQIGGRTIPRGDFVVLALGSANRDPKVYSNPDSLDVSRRDIRPLYFGGGIHFCIGAQLARVELEIALRTVYEAFPMIRLPDIEKVIWRPSCVWRGLESLRAQWG